MNLLQSEWLPTDCGLQTPLQALQSASSIKWPRGDWNAATFCFLHALLQTAVVLKPERCPDRDAWEVIADCPPSNLGTWLDMDLGDAPWECPTADGLVSIGRLLPETPGENALKKASDIGRWSQEVPEALSLPEATIAVISDNFWGTRIGTGYRQGARGEQPLTTLLESGERGASLWKNLWLNVMPADIWQRRFGKDTLSFEFPWKQPLGNTEITPKNAHSLTILWQMPRRWRLVFDADGWVRNVHRENGGRNYSGWERLHPLTPYFVKADGTWVAAKVAPHTGFDDWAAIALQLSSKTQPATVVVEFMQSAWRGEPIRLRCCGWALGDAGAIGTWVDHVVPYYQKSEDQAALVEKAIAEAENQRKQLAGVLAVARRGMQRYASELYSLAEPSFYRRVANDDWSDWSSDLKRMARALFWRIAQDHKIDTFAAARAASKL